MTTKICPKCKEEKETTKFNKNKRTKSGISVYCKECEKERNSNFRKSNPDYGKKYSQKNYVRGSRKEYYLLKMYGISFSEYEAMLSSQNHSCAICGKHESHFSMKLAVDHYHIRNFKKFPPEEKKKYIRGLLCFRCNRGIFAENPDLLLSASVYFRRHEHMKIPFSAVKN
jgi:superfamily II helicase